MFKEYVLNWYNEYIVDHEDNAEEILKSLGKNISDLEEDETAMDYLEFVDDAELIYSAFFISKPEKLEDVPDTTDFLVDMFKSVSLPEYGFVDDYLYDMAYHASGYENPRNFFSDLAYGGCQSGLIGMLIYNSDCKKIYIEHLDDFENMVEEYQEELGEPLENKSGLPRYTFVTWFAYEELGFTVANQLWSDF